MTKRILIALALFFSVQFGTAQTSAEVDAIYPSIDALYIDLHQHPELSFQEVQTAAKLAAIVRAAGYEVTAGVGRTGIVAVMKNGAGPTVMLRIYSCDACLRT
jgi:hippurate hydrolase